MGFSNSILVSPQTLLCVNPTLCSEGACCKHLSGKGNKILCFPMIYTAEVQCQIHLSALKCMALWSLVETCRALEAFALKTDL